MIGGLWLLVSQLGLAIRGILRRHGSISLFDGVWLIVQIWRGCCPLADGFCFYASVCDMIQREGPFADKSLQTSQVFLLSHVHHVWPVCADPNGNMDMQVVSHSSQATLGYLPGPLAALLAPLIIPGVVRLHCTFLEAPRTANLSCSYPAPGEQPAGSAAR